LRKCLRDVYESKNFDDKIKNANELVNRRYNYSRVSDMIKDALNTLIPGIVGKLES